MFFALDYKPYSIEGKDSIEYSRSGLAQKIDNIT